MSIEKNKKDINKNSIYTTDIIPVLIASAVKTGTMMDRTIRSYLNKCIIRIVNTFVLDNGWSCRIIIPFCLGNRLKQIKGVGIMTANSVICRINATRPNCVVFG